MTSLPTARIHRLITTTIVVLVLACQAHAQDRERLDQRAAHLHELLEMLERGHAALDELGRHDLREAVGDVANEVRQELEELHRHADRAEWERHREGEGRSEREIIEARADLFRLAFKAMVEAGKHEQAQRVEHAIHKYEIMLEGARGDDARRVREGAPKWFEEIELLGYAAHVYREQFGMLERAQMILERRDQLWPGWRERAQRETAERRGRDHAGNREREIAMHRLEMMRMAMPALLESGRHDAAELLERAMHAMEMNLEGREDPEAREIRRRSPDLGAQVELLMLASDLWEKLGHERKAAELRQHAREMGEALRQRNERNRARQEAERRSGSDREIELLERMEAMQAQIEELRRQLEEMRRER